MLRSIRLLGIHIGSADMFREMNRAIAATRLRPVIARTFTFDHAAYAYAYNFHETTSHFGKTVISSSQ